MKQGRQCEAGAYRVVLLGATAELALELSCFFIARFGADGVTPPAEFHLHLQGSAELLGDENGDASLAAAALEAESLWNKTPYAACVHPPAAGHNPLLGADMVVDALHGPDDELRIKRLELDMSLLCPRGRFVRHGLGASLFDELEEALAGGCSGA